jgi:Domain of unknown function (DUF4158)
VDPAELRGYDWSGRSAERHHGQIRRLFGFRRFSEDDEVKLAGWLADEVAAVELADERLREALLARCRAERIEPPARVNRILGAARATVAERFTATTASRLSPPTVLGLERLAGITGEGPDPVAGMWLAELKADPGRVSRATMAAELAKLARVRSLELPAGLFDGWSERLVAAWRARAATEYPSDLRSHPQPVRLTLLAAPCWVRQGELVDGLVDLLIALIHKIGARAEQTAERQLLADLRRVRGKEGQPRSAARSAGRRSPTRRSPAGGRRRQERRSGRRCLRSRRGWTTWRRHRLLAAARSAGRRCHVESAMFDDPNLVSCAGLRPVVGLAEQCGLSQLGAGQLTLPAKAGVNAHLKVPALVGAMVAGADSIADTNLRHGGMDRLFGEVRAPSTLGTFLRAFTFGHVRQLDAVAGRLLAELARRSPLLPGADRVAYVDIDDTVKATYGYAKQGAGYGYSGVKGLNALLATVSSPLAAPVIVATRLRKGSTNSARGAPRLVADALAAAKAAGAGGPSGRS